MNFPKLIKHVVLIGASGVGKSTLAPVLAGQLNMPSCDTDDLIDHTFSTTGGRIIEQQGISAFRAIEERIVNDILKSPVPHVIATGAGAWTIASVRQECLRSGISVWLKLSFDELVRRVTGSSRYITKVRPPEIVISEQIRCRMALYAQADVQIDCDRMSVDQTAVAISQLLG